MEPVTPRYPIEEIARRGDAIYQQEILPKMTAKEVGKFLAIDIDTGEYEISVSELRACKKLRSRLPQSQTWMVRVGYAAAHSFGGGLKRVDLPA